MHRSSDVCDRRHHSTLNKLLHVRYNHFLGERKNRLGRVRVLIVVDYGMPYTKVPISSLDILNRGLCGRLSYFLGCVIQMYMKGGELCWWPKSLQISFIAAWLMIFSSVYISTPPKQCRMPTAYVAQEQKLQSEQMRWAWSFFRDSDAIWCGEAAQKYLDSLLQPTYPRIPWYLYFQDRTDAALMNFSV